MLTEQSKAAMVAATVAAKLVRPDQFKPVSHGVAGGENSALMLTRTFFSRYAVAVLADWGEYGALALSATGKLYMLDRTFNGNFAEDSEYVYQVEVVGSSPVERNALRELLFAPHRDARWWDIPLPSQNSAVLARQRAIDEKRFKPRKRKKSQPNGRPPAIVEAVR